MCWRLALASETVDWLPDSPMRCLKALPVML